MGFFKEFFDFRIGLYPKEYNREIHGPYDPAKYYGKPDTKFGDVKLGELHKWLWRRNLGVRSFMALNSRAYWRWQQKYVQPLKGGIAPLLQLAVSSSIIYYILNAKRIRKHKSAKYH